MSNAAKLRSGVEARQPFGIASALDGGRTWWAHFEFTRINIAPTILRKKIEEWHQLGAFMFTVELSVCGPRLARSAG
jgi:hypothetical protein